ncbi:glycerophosphodiester phosphodiesterase family protein [uncultured Cohaesibacter sp.]|uniref:glycerophosphodiester phosphodiesterase family protein n=1 Tax=uncultured Cohaesibacter sp. TaxID=1002546 RepID=UPI002AAA6A4A|nr:glycerophosphodiester phosphodiesterase family protein [uncultured Cohaesibacter sp.]
MTRIASHRGGTLEYGDSTLAGFTATAAMAVEEVEFDVHPTKDGDIIVHHDATLDRTTDTAGAIADLPTREVLSAVINFSHNSRPILLQELCEIFDDSSVVFRCEFKPGADGKPYQGFVPRVMELLAREDMLRTANFSSFLLDYLDEIAEHTDRPRLWLVSPAVLTQLGEKGVLDMARARDISEIGVHIDKASPTLMAATQDAGLAFGCWAAHTTPQISKAISMGVKIFTTDRPSLAVAIRNQMREGTGQ